MKLHIITVGISLLTNYAKARNLPLETALKHNRQLAEFLKADSRVACSELNSLDARTGLLKKKPRDLRVSLVHAATAKRESELAAKLIEKFLLARGVEVTRIKLKDIGVPANPQADPIEAARLAEAGLIRLYDTLESHIAKWRKQFPDLDVQLNVTGGYKAEAAVVYGLGLALGIPVYYLHESYKVAITLPVCGVPF